MKNFIKFTKCKIAISTVMFLASVVASCGTMRAELIFTPAGSDTGSVEISQELIDGGLVRATLSMRVSRAITAFSGGFGVSGGVFNQAPANQPFASGGPLDTSFILDSSVGTFFNAGQGSADTQNVLSAGTGVAFLAGRWGPADESFIFAQLVTTPGAIISTLPGNPQQALGPLTLAGGTGAIGVISGSFTAVPEPSSLLLSTLVLAGSLPIRRRRC